jgi:pilus assembly protein CpaE
MSAAASSSYSVLLPAASIAVFSNHDDTRAVVAALAQDWRFARVKIEVQAGDVAHAIHAFASRPSPNLLIVDTDVIDSSFTALLEQLAGVCAEGTDAVVVGPVNDVALYRYLINLGVGDYLVRPIQAPVIADVIARLLLAQLGASDSQLVAVIGARGGVGVSTVSGALAYGLAEVRDQKTILMDVAAGRSYLSVSFGFEPVATSQDMARAAVANDASALQRMFLKYGKNLQVLGTGNDKFFEEHLTPDHIERVLDRILATTPFVVVDLSDTTVAIQKMVLSRAQRVFVVSWPTLSSLRLARTMLNEIKDMKGGSLDIVELVLNMCGMSPGLEVGKADIDHALGHKASVQVAFDPKLVIGAESSTKVLGSLKGSEKMVADLLARMHLTPRNNDDPKGGGGGLFDQLIRKVGK